MPITCPFKSLGCTWGGLESLDDVSEHIATAGLAHAALIANAIGLRNAGLPDHCMETMKIELNNLVIKVACLEDEVRGMKSELTVLRLNAVTAERMIAQHFNRLGTCSTLLESCQLNTSMCEAATYDGKCMWTIPDYSKHLAEAESGKYLFHISAPFYLTRYGYKLCLKVFLMGNGTGLDTHVSLFLVVMKGLNDAILEWPFKQTFTMMMRDHITKKYYDKTCCTSTTNLSDGVRSPFVRPTEEMNYGGGWTQFISHRDLMKGNYIVEDKLFIECVVT